MRDLNDLANRMESLIGKASEGANVRAIAAGKAILQDLTFIATPVDTSTALSNWQVGIGAPDRAFRPAFFFGSKGSTRGVSAQAAFAEGLQKLSAKKPGETIYISNATPYISELDRGSSAQFRFPGGFRERARIVGREAAKNLRAE